MLFFTYVTEIYTYEILPNQKIQNERRRYPENHYICMINNEFEYFYIYS